VKGKGEINQGNQQQKSATYSVQRTTEIGKRDIEQVICNPFAPHKIFCTGATHVVNKPSISFVICK
jgi:hypothetical protein